jgi:hypothetical protein
LGVGVRGNFNGRISRVRAVMSATAASMAALSAFWSASSSGVVGSGTPALGGTKSGGITS